MPADKRRVARTTRASQGTGGDLDSAIYPCQGGYSGDEISLKSMPGLAMHHPR